MQLVNASLCFFGVIVRGVEFLLLVVRNPRLCFSETCLTFMYWRNGLSLDILSMISNDMIYSKLCNLPNSCNSRHLFSIVREAYQFNWAFWAGCPWYGISFEINITIWEKLIRPWQIFCRDIKSHDYSQAWYLISSTARFYYNQKVSRPWWYHMLPPYFFSWPLSLQVP